MALAAVSIAAAVAIGIASAIAWTLWLLPLVAFGGFIVVAYNLELFGGLFHRYLWFGIAWGALPVLAAYVVQAGVDRARPPSSRQSAATLLSLAQRSLSTRVRDMRRRAVAVHGTVEYRDGTRRGADRGRPDGRARACAPPARGGRHGTRSSDGARAGLRFLACS